MTPIHHFKTHKNEYYSVEFTKFKRTKGQSELLGLCDPPDESGALIQLEERQTDGELFNSAIHESLHAFFFDKSETSVERCSNTIVTLLKKLGFQIVRKK